MAASLADLEPKLAWTTTIKYAFASFSLYATNAVLHYCRSWYQRFFPSPNGPDLIKSYPCRPWLPVRIFLPPPHQPSAAAPSTAKLPVLLTIHGGGFVVGSPLDSDAWNRDFAQRHGAVVVALDYSKAPVSPFPRAIYDVEAVVLAVLADHRSSALPIDRARVALAGWSAGGNLALAAASLPSLRGDGEASRRVHAVVPMYPVVDFTVTPEQKAATRPYKPQLFRGDSVRGRTTDFLYPLAPLFNWAYLPVFQPWGPGRRDDPLLSPFFASREALPPYVFLLGCELDMLAMGAWRLACRLAGRPLPDTLRDQVGQPDAVAPAGALILDDDSPRFSFETRTPSSSYRWLLVPDMVHGFDQGLEKRLRDRALADDVRQKRDQCMALIAEWLFAGPFADRKT